MEITTATEKHIPEIVELWKEFMDFHKDIDPRFPMRENAAENWENHLNGFMNSEDALVLITNDDTKVVGFAIAHIINYPPLWEREKYGTIDSIAVTTPYRRKGLGEQLLSTIYEWFDSRGIERIELSIETGNQVSASFWKKHGFKDFMHRLYLDRG